MACLGQSIKVLLNVGLEQRKGLEEPAAHTHQYCGAGL